MIAERRLCLIGNSHLAALHAGWAAAAPAGVEAVLVGLSTPRLAEVEVRQGYLRPSSDAACAEFIRFVPSGAFALATVDAFVVVGGGFGCFRLVETYAGARYTGLAAPAGGGAAGPALVSRAAFRRAVRDGLAATPGWRLAAELCRHGARVVMVAQPAPSAAAPPGAPALRLQRWAERVGDAAELGRILDEACEELSAGGVRVLRQPDASRAGPLLTAARYMNDAPKLAAGGDAGVQPPGDFLHANARYGCLMLAALFAALDLGVGPEPRLAQG